MIQLEVEGNYRRSRQEVESLTERIDSVNRELIIRNEMVETLKQQLDTKTTEFDVARDELLESKGSQKEQDKAVAMSVDDSTSASTSTATLQEADMGRGQIRVQSRPGKSELIYSRGVVP